MAICSICLDTIAENIEKRVLSSRLSSPLAIGKNLYALPYSFDLEDMKEGRKRGAIVFSLRPNEPFITLSEEKFTKINENTPFFNNLKKISYFKVKSIRKIKGERTIIFELISDERSFDTLISKYYLIFNIIPYKPNCLLVDKDHKIISLFHEKIDFEKDIFLARNSTYSFPEDREFPDDDDFLSYQTFICRSTYRYSISYLEKNPSVAPHEFFKEMRDRKELYLNNGDILPFKFDDSMKKISLEDIYSLFVTDQKNEAKIEKEKELLKTIDKSIKFAIKKRGKLEKDYQNNKDYQMYMLYGQTILLYQTEISKEDEVLCKDGLSIPLNPLLTPVENANLYFKKYNKGKTAVKILSDLQKRCEEEILYLKKKEMEARDGTPRDIIELKAELISLNYLRGKNSSVKSVLKKKSYAPHYLKCDYCKIGYGNNGLQNEELTFKMAKKDDIFIHVKDYPGSHVVILEYTDLNKAINLACQLALYLSHLEDGTVYIAKKKDVKKNPSKIGLVNILKYETCYVRGIEKENLSIFQNLN